MRRKIYFVLSGSPMLILLSCLLPGCFKDHITMSYTIYRPVYTPTATVLANLNGNPSQPIVSAGKIYSAGPYIFVNDIDKGIHIIDNSDPAHPTQIAFLAIPGNEDMAVRGNMLYADMYSDLLAIDMYEPKHAVITGMVHGVFSSRAFVGGSIVNVNGNLVDSGDVITSWIVKDTTVASSDPGKPYPIYYGGGLLFASAAPSASNSGTGATGTGGSMAKMTLVNDYLYAITESHSMGIIDLKNAGVPVLLSSHYPGFDLETIFPFQNELFLGSEEGVFMYDITDPANPVSKGTFTHGRACDPVIADGNFAYITLHAGTSCGGASNELDVVKIDNMQVNSAATIYPMTSPKGLSKDGNLLFVCDGNTGVKVFDATDPLHLKSVNNIGNAEGYDVIAGNHHLLLVATQGLYQYSYTDQGQASLLSFLPVK